MQEILIVGAGGFIGSNLRYYSTKLFTHLFGNSFPYGTLFVNVTGSFILGLITALPLLNPSIDPKYKLFIGTGMMGALTTFSTFSIETLDLLNSQSYGLAFTNIALNLALSLFAGAIGLILAKQLI